MNYIMGLIVFIAFLIVLGFLIIKTKEAILVSIQNNKEEVYRVRVLILKKIIEDNVIRPHENSNVFSDEPESEEDTYNERNNNSNTYFIICKNLKSKEQLSFQVKPEFYKSITTGCEGILTYQGNKFKQFIVI